MPRACSICNHDNRESIEEALEAGETLRVIAARYGVSIAALSRHRAHIADNKPEPSPRKEDNTVPKPPLSDSSEIYVPSLVLVCPNCGKMEIYLAGWLSDKQTAIIECPWCPYTGYVKGLAIGTIDLSLDLTTEISMKSESPPFEENETVGFCYETKPVF